MPGDAQRARRRAGGAWRPRGRTWSCRRRSGRAARATWPDSATRSSPSRACVFAEALLEAVGLDRRCHLRSSSSSRWAGGGDLAQPLLRPGAGATLEVGDHTAQPPPARPRASSAGTPPRAGTGAAGRGGTADRGLRVGELAREPVGARARAARAPSGGEPEEHRHRGDELRELLPVVAQHPRATRARLRPASVIAYDDPVGIRPRCARSQTLDQPEAHEPLERLVQARARPDVDNAVLALARAASGSRRRARPLQSGQSTIRPRVDLRGVDGCGIAVNVLVSVYLVNPSAWRPWWSAATGARRRDPRRRPVAAPGGHGAQSARTRRRRRSAPEAPNSNL